MGNQGGQSQNESIKEVETIKNHTHVFLFENEEEKLLEYL